MSQISRVVTFADGQPPYADDLNSEFNQIVAVINASSDDNFASGANIDPLKIASSIAGSGALRVGLTGILEINPDDSTLEINSDILRVKDLGITSDKLAASAVTTAKILDANVTRAKITNNYQTASLSSDQNITANGTQITGFSLEITTSGRPVFVAIYNSNIEMVDPGIAVNGSSTTFSTFFVRNGTTIARNDYVQFQSTVTTVAIGQRATTLKLPLAQFSIDTPAAGTYTYTVIVSPNISSSKTCSVKSGLKFFVMELV